MSLRDRLHDRPVKLTKLDIFGAFIANLSEDEKDAAHEILTDKDAYPANEVVDIFLEEYNFKLTPKNVWDWRKANDAR
jgi:hypothetical protein